jgi:hypothetical protein
MLETPMEILHTPRLCIDGRPAKQFGHRGLMAQEVIDQLVSGFGEENASSEWIEKKRTVLLAHPSQVFSGQLKRFDTKRKISGSLLYWIWEKQFSQTSQISRFHRFRSVDNLNPSLKIPTLTTLLPAKGRLPFFISRRNSQQYVVPSHQDRKLLEKSYHLPEEQIHVFRPGTRRYVHFIESFKHSGYGNILFLVGDKKGAKNLKKLQKVFSEVYVNIPQKVIHLKDSTNVSPTLWLKLLQNTKVLVYLSSQPFDWATLPLEAIYWNVPTLFQDSNSALNELLPQSPLRLSQFLVNQPEFNELKTLSRKAKDELERQGVFTPLNMAEQYTGLYRQMGAPTGPDIPETGCCN